MIGECYTSVPVRMMTEEMALEELKKLKECNYRNPNSDADWKVYDAINMAIITLERQMPKKAGLIGNVFDDMPMAWVCPTCEEIVVPHSHHCTCGQALDWSEDNADIE